MAQAILLTDAKSEQFVYIGMAKVALSERCYNI